MTFSNRQGIVPVPIQMTPTAMTAELRASLWNALHIHIWGEARFRDSYSRYGLWHRYAEVLWFEFFKKSFSTLPDNADDLLRTLEQFLGQATWNGVYDFVETVMGIAVDADLDAEIDAVLRRELAAYRVMNRQFVPITSEDEVALLSQEMGDSNFPSVAQHLSAALAQFANRTAPDYRNSIKESISAVEAMARIVSGNPKATLGDALSAVEKAGGLHKALKSGFSAIYGYTNDADGIRHAMMDEPNLTIEDAKFFLFSCTSFTNYLKAKLPG